MKYVSQVAREPQHTGLTYVGGMGPSQAKTRVDNFLHNTMIRFESDTK